MPLLATASLRAPLCTNPCLLRLQRRRVPVHRGVSCPCSPRLRAEAIWDVRVMTLPSAFYVFQAGARLAARGEGTPAVCWGSAAATSPTAWRSRRPGDGPPSWDSRPTPPPSTAPPPQPTPPTPAPGLATGPRVRPFQEHSGHMSSTAIGVFGLPLRSYLLATNCPLVTTARRPLRLIFCCSPGVWLVLHNMRNNHWIAALGQFESSSKWSVWVTPKADAVQLLISNRGDEDSIFLNF